MVLHDDVNIIIHPSTNLDVMVFPGEPEGPLLRYAARSLSQGRDCDHRHRSVHPPVLPDAQLYGIFGDRGQAQGSR